MLIQNRPQNVSNYPAPVWFKKAEIGNHIF